MNLPHIKFAKDTMLTIGARISVFVLTMLTSVLIARILGPEGKGIYALAILLPTIITRFTNLGIAPASVYHIGQNVFDEKLVFGNNVLLSAILGCVSICIGVICIVFLHNTFFAGINKWYLLLVLLLGPLLLFNVYLMFVLLGMEKIKAYNLMAILHACFLFTLSMIALLILHAGVLGILIALILSFVFANLFLFFSVKSYTHGISFDLSLNYLKKMLNFGGASNTSNILTYLNYRFGMLLVSYFLTTVAVGFYSIAVGIAEQLWLVSTAVGTVLFPRISTERNEYTRRKLTPVVTRNVLMITALGALGLYFVSPWLVTFIYTETFSFSIKPLQILLPGVVALSVWQLLHQDIAGRGKPMLNVYVNLIAVILNVLLSLLLIPKYGISGAAWATTFSYCGALLGAAVIYKRLTNSPLSKMFVPQHSDLRLYKQIYSHLLTSNDNKKNK